MRHRNNRSLAAAAAAATVAAATAGAYAAVVSSVTDLGAPTITNGTTGFVTTYGGFEAFLLTISTTDGTPISAVNFGGTASSPTFGIAGTSLLQRASLVTDPDTGTTTRTLTPQSTALNNSGTSNTFDSHWLTPASQAATVAAPAEDNNGVNLPGGPADTTASDYGTGTMLTETVGILGASQSSTLPLAYVVIPRTAIATYNGTVSVQGVATPVSGTFAVSAVPEPATAGLAAAAAVGLLARRRRA